MADRHQSLDLISIIIPCYNEQDVIETCHKSVTDVIDTLPFRFEIIYIDDGSRDNTMELLRALRAKDKRVTIISLSRNFGKEVATTAGLDTCKGIAAIILDSDLQDPPVLIPDLIRIWKEQDADVVYGQRRTREGETWLKKATAAFFYRAMNFISEVYIPRDTGDFRLMNRRAIDALNKLREHHRFMKGLFAWIGYKQVAFQYDRKPRIAGATKYNYFKLSDYALEGITAFSMTPLRIASLCGFIISIFAFMYGGYILLHAIFVGRDLPGYSSLMVVFTFLSGIQLLTIGILGEYIGRIFGETKNRPLYFIQEKIEGE